MSATGASRPRHSARPRAAPGDRRRELGALGERIAAEHLVRLGFSVLARNVRMPAGEIDLIACDGRTLVFVEVKAELAGSRGDGQTPALARLDARQRARIRRAAAAWLCDPTRPRPSARELRLDAVGVRVDRAGRLLALDHVESAW